MRKILATLIAVITIITIGFASNSKVNAVNNGVDDFVRRLYSVCLDRSADPQGLNDWSSALKNKKATGISAAYGFVFSQEFQSKKCTNEQYVTYMYNAFFGRQPDAVGLQGWVDALNQGYSRERVFCGFANSTEFQILCDSYGIVRGYHVEGSNFAQTAQVNLFVDRLYSEVLGRKCDPQGMADWTSVLVSRKATGADVAYGLVFSPEFTGKNYCNDHYVKVLYRAFFNRSADSSGLASWSQALEDGSSREAVFSGFVGSKEFITICKQYGIESGSIKLTGTGTLGNGRCASCEGFTINGKSQIGFFEYKGDQYYNTSRTKAFYGWKEIDGNSYFFNENKGGKAAHGWLEYYSDWYYFSNSGVMQTKWKQINGKWYYFDPKDGALYINGFYKIDDATYGFDKDGAAIHGWYKDPEGEWHYFDPDSYKLVLGWKELNGKWYYFVDLDSEYPGYMCRKGIHHINGYPYLFDSEGVMLTGWQKDDYGDWHYFDETPGKNLGKGYEKTWHKIDGKYYYFDSSGCMKSDRFVDKDGNDIRGFMQDSDDIYYLRPNGAMAEGWYTLESENSYYNGRYYFTPGSGKAVRGWKEIDGKVFYFFDNYKAAVGVTCVQDANYNLIGWYYFDENGVGSGWIAVDNQVYYFDPDTKKALSYGFHKIEGNWYFVSAAGWIVRNGAVDRYYAGEDGIIIGYPG